MVKIHRKSKKSLKNPIICFLQDQASISKLVNTIPKIVEVRASLKRKLTYLTVEDQHNVP